MQRVRLLAIAMPLLIAATSTSWGQTIVTFEELPLTSNSFHNGNPGGTSDIVHDGSFTSQGATFANDYSRTTFGTPPNDFQVESWNGWAYSTMTDTTTPGFGNQYSAFAGTGSGGSETYGVSFGSFGDNSITIPTGQPFQSIDITNTTYAALSMLQGDSFAKKFGGASGNDPDFFKLTISGRSGGAAGAIVGDIEVYLADYRFSDNSLDYVLDEWTTINLSSLVGADTLTFSYESSDNHPTFGMNTPAFFAADNLVFGAAAVPEPSALVIALLAAVVAVVTQRWVKQRREVA
jgi:hypothetical protein